MPQAELRALDGQARARVRNEFRRPLVVEAGAGTGKTTTLIARMVAWAAGAGWEKARAQLRGEPPGRVAERVLARMVAITFTEAAAAEMADRFAEGLHELASGRAPRGVVVEELGADADALRSRARALLESLDFCTMTTIHAWCRKLLARFPFDAGLDPSFEVDADGVLVTSICEDVVARHLPDAYARGSAEPAWILASLGVGPTEIVEALTVLAGGAIDAAALEGDPFAPDVFEPRVDGLRSALNAVIELEAGRFAASGKTRGAGAALSGLRSLRAAAGETSSRPDPDALCRAVREERTDSLRKKLGDWAKGRCTQSEEAALDADEGAFIDACASLDPQLAAFSRFEPVVARAACAALAPMLTDARAQMRERGVLGFDDLLVGAASLLESRPRVATAVRASMDQLLVDEFQDTDGVQCSIVRRLALDGPAPARPGLLLVGDPKQSIYGWRSADLAAYEAMVASVVAVGGEEHRLYVSFRSTPAILDEVERIVRPVMRHEPGLQPAFFPLIPTRGPSPDGAVEHWRCADAAVPSEEPTRTTSSRAVEIEAGAMARDIRERVAAEGRRFADFGILLRGASDLEVYLRALRDAGVPYAVERDRGYYRRREVIDAAATLRAVLDPYDALAALTWMRSSWVGVPDAALLPLWREGFPGRLAAMEEPDDRAHHRCHEAIATAAAAIPDDVPAEAMVEGWEVLLRHSVDELARLRQVARRSSIERLVEALRVGMLCEIAEAGRYLGAYRLANLDRFFRQVLADPRGVLGDRDHLLGTLRRAVRTAVDAEEARPPQSAGDAVRLMTIHKAKGLDFDVVYVAQLHKRSGERRGKGTSIHPLGGGRALELFGASTPSVEDARARAERVASAERVRTLYVALTRARDVLVMSSADPSGDALVDPADASSHLDLIGAREGGHPDVAGEPPGRVEEGGVVWRRVTPVEDDSGGPRRRPPPDRSNAAAVRALADELERRAAIARERSARPLGGTPSSLGAHGAAGADAYAAAGATWSEVGTAVHALFENLPLDVPPARFGPDERAWILGRVAGRPGVDAGAAAARIDELLASLDAGRILARFGAIRGSILARELPILLPPRAGVDDALSYVSGVIDLVYRDPDDGEIVVADYKTDRVVGDDVEEKIAQHAAQGAAYVRAVQEAFELPSAPRFELWLLDIDRIVG